MKLLVFLSFLLLFFSTCEKKVEYISATVVRDCSGTYVRMDGKEYFVCNPEKIASAVDGAEVQFTYVSCDACTDRQEHCLIARPYESCITLVKSK
jgi:hypothetical protein